MRVLGLCLLAVCMSTVIRAEHAPTVCSDGKCIQIGSMNIELLGSNRKPYNQVNRGARTDKQIQRLADQVTSDFDMEIVVFQEINTESEEWQKLRDLLKANGYHFFEGMTSDRNQYVVLGWDAEEVALVKDTAKELDVRSDFDFGDGCHDEELRRPVVGQFKAGEFDFWVIGVHLKSRSGTMDCTRRIRTEQCKDLKSEVDNIVSSSGERDIIIVGDYNERPGHESFKPLIDGGFSSQMKFLMPNSAKGSYVKTDLPHQSNDLIDQVMLRYSDTKEVVPNSAYVMPLASRDAAETYIIEQSDHVPVCVSFRIDQDRD